MPRNGSGTYILPATVNPVVDGQTITSTWANTSLNDLAAAITGSIAADGQTPFSGVLKVSDGTIGSPAVAFNSEPTTGFYHPTSQSLAFVIANNEKLRISSGNITLAGNVFATTGSVVGGTGDLSASGLNAILAVTGGTLNLDDSQSIAWGGGTGRSEISGSKAGAYLTLNVAGAGAIANVTATGISLTGNITPTTNATFNLGSATNKFNNIYGTATNALYADLAERYASDSAYAPGTVVSFGGDKEVTLSVNDSDTSVAGVVSTAPAFLMNCDQSGTSVAVALTGRVPTKVVGKIKKGDLMVSAGNGYARAENEPVIGSVIGKALADFDGDYGVIEVVVGRY